MQTKAGIMVGLGERDDELLAVMRDLRAVECDILTLGQYLRPSTDHLPVARYVTPADFAELRAEGMKLGFRHVESGPAGAQTRTTPGNTSTKSANVARRSEETAAADGRRPNPDAPRYVRASAPTRRGGEILKPVSTSVLR